MRRNRGYDRALWITGDGHYEVQQTVKGWTQPTMPAARNIAYGTSLGRQALDCVSVGMYIQPILTFFGPQPTPTIPQGVYSTEQLRGFYRNSSKVGGTSSVVTDKYACGTGSAKLILERWHCPFLGHFCTWKLLGDRTAILHANGVLVFEPITADKVEGEKYRMSVFFTTGALSPGKRIPQPGTKTNDPQFSQEVVF
jgi:hypothetical protein